MAKRKTIGVYTPYLQGFYFGELVSQLQQYAFLKGYNFTVIKTGGFNSFKSTMHSAHIDYAVILRNAIHNDLAQHLLNLGTPVASIAYDYFPLAIPMVTSDNDHGTELAFNHLIQKGHRELAFVGDLSQYDIRKRYEAFCDQCEINQFDLNEKNIFVVNDTLFSGGYQAASDYVKSGCTAKGIICGASLTSIGFSQQLRHLLSDTDSLDIVGFDAISLIPITEPNMTMVDQNLHLMAYKTINILESLRNEEDLERHHFVDPKLITASSDFMQAEDAFLATSTEIAELHNANYMKSVINNLEEWPKTIVESNLDTLMTLSPLFEKYMQRACYGRTAISKNGREYIKVTKLFLQTDVKRFAKSDMDTLSESSAYPATAVDIQSDAFDTSVHMPIFQNNRLWSVLSVYGSSKQASKPSSFSAFSAYLDNIANHLKIKAQEGQQPTQGESTNKEEDNAPVAAGTVKWSPTANETEWDNESLSAIGLVSDLEHNIYRHMDLTDRIHPDDDTTLRSCLLSANDQEFNINVRLKHKNKSYMPFQIERGNIEDDGTVILLLTLVNSAG